MVWKRWLSNSGRIDRPKRCLLRQLSPFSRSPPGALQTGKSPLCGPLRDLKILFGVLSEAAERTFRSLKGPQRGLFPFWSPLRDLKILSAVLPELAERTFRSLRGPQRGLFPLLRTPADPGRTSGAAPEKRVSW